MDRSRSRELFWLVLIAGCIALFVYQREHNHRGYDRNGLNEPVRVSRTAEVRDPNDDIVTGSITPTAAQRRPLIGRYYVPLGSYGSIDMATSRYLELAHRDPALERGNKLKIETVRLKGDGTFHRVRMGNFATTREARMACAKAGLATYQCPVVAAR